MLAHSARPKLGIPSQDYRAHVVAVVDGAVAHARSAAAFRRGERRFFQKLIEYAAIVHDLGKLDPENQKVLASTYRAGLPWAHEDAGTKHLLDQRQIEAALLVASHHAGLPDVPAEENKGAHYGRQDKPGLRERTDALLPGYLREQFAVFTPQVPPRPAEMGRFEWSALARRIALSCLVDADHGDTARHYRNQSAAPPVPALWAERLTALDTYVAGLPITRVNPERLEIRQLVYQACRGLAPSGNMYACDAGVGTGKTTAVMAHCLRIAAARELRHVIVVLPFTNIIRQSVEIYRQSLCLPGENPARIVAEHHHQADFELLASRPLATLWDGPITVTTAVQFFETLAGHSTAALRKLHDLPGSVIFIDEAHAAIPTWLWRQTWKWLRELTEDWGCHVVLASGSLARFWQVQPVVEETTTLPNLIPDPLRARIQSSERHRVVLRTLPEQLSLEALIRFVLDRPSPRLVILNTVQSAAVLANEMNLKGLDVMHLSTVLTPRDRARIIQRIKDKLEAGGGDWTLVATSCIEAGVDLSFSSGVRESATTASLIQTSGRVNRHRITDSAEVWDVRLDDPLFNRHPAFTDSRAVLAHLFSLKLVEQLAPDELITKAMEMEASRYSARKSPDLCTLENQLNFPEVARLYRVIDSPTVTVVIDPATVQSLQSGLRVAPGELVTNSVQFWPQRARDLALPLIEGHAELYRWDRAYDPELLGCMISVLPMIYANRDSFYMV